MYSDDSFKGRFKKAVERNFDESAAVYDQFEEKHHLFETLTRRMCELNAPFSLKRVLDVGCGTGISTLAIRKSLSDDAVLYGIDISEPMLVKARERCRGIPNIFFVGGDAEKLSAYFHEAFDAVFYTASIFLLPDFQKSISQACRLIVPGGLLAISYYDGLFDKRGRDAVKRAFPDKPYRYGAVSYEDLMKCLRSIRGFRTTEFDYRFEVGEDFLFDFLSIPAQSAGIFPKVSYIDRIPMVRDWCRKLVEEVSPIFMGWKFVLSRHARKRQPRQHHLT
ncbi:MAG: hypothetical protein Kow00128_10750 [Deltaproteobacteria bacterium]